MQKTNTYLQKIHYDMPEFGLIASIFLNTIYNWNQDNKRRMRLEKYMIQFLSQVWSPIGLQRKYHRLSIWMVVYECFLVEGGTNGTNKKEV